MEHKEKKLRKRERAFEHSEKAVLLDLVTEHYNVVESKKTDAVSVRMKNAEWMKIAEEFSAVSSTYARDYLSLKTLWENLKRKAKLVMAAQADNLYGTGGGKAKKIIADPIVDMVVELIRPHVGPFMHTYDDNSEDISEIITDSNALDDQEVELNRNAIDEHSICVDWSQYNPTMLKTPISATLRQSPLPTSQPQAFTSTLPSQTCSAADMTPTVAATEKPAVRDKKGESRRRPVLSSSASETLLEAKISSLSSATADAREEHKVQMQILQLQKQQEEEKLAQEKIKTELLKLQLQRETEVEVIYPNEHQK